MHWVWGRKTEKHQHEPISEMDGKQSGVNQEAILICHISITVARDTDCSKSMAKPFCENANSKEFDLICKYTFEWAVYKWSVNSAETTIFSINSYVCFSCFVIQVYIGHCLILCCIVVNWHLQWYNMHMLPLHCIFITQQMAMITCATHSKHSPHHMPYQKSMFGSRIERFYRESHPIAAIFLLKNVAKDGFDSTSLLHIVRMEVCKMSIEAHIPKIHYVYDVR